MTFRREILLGLFLLSLAPLLVTTRQYRVEDRKITERAMASVLGEAASAAHHLDEEFRSIMGDVGSVAKALNDETLDSEALDKRMHDLLEAHPELVVSCTIYVPYAFAPDTRLHAPCQRRDDDGIKRLQLEDVVDYTSPTELWYHELAARGKEFWVDPFKDTGTFTKGLVSLFGAPFWRTDSSTNETRLAGIVIVVAPIASFDRTITSLDLGQSGYGYLLSRKGNFISHPVEGLVAQQRSIFDVVTEDESIEALPHIQRALDGTDMLIDLTIRRTGTDLWVAFQSIPATGWTLAANFLKDDIRLTADVLRRKSISISIYALFSLGLLLSLLLGFFHTGIVLMWQIALAISVLFVTEIGVLWYLNLNPTAWETDGSVAIVSQEVLNKFIRRQLETPAAGPGEPLVTLPTGLLIQSLSFKNATDIQITGYLWQKRRVSPGADLNEPDSGQDARRTRFGVLFVDAVEHSDEVVSRTQSDGVEQIDWYFETTIRGNFDYSHYPFDGKNFELRMRYRDLSQRVLLVPDLKPYRLMNPSRLPGIKARLTVPGWELRRSYFDYPDEERSVLASTLTRGLTPTLRFNVIAQREFLGPFITNLLPLLVIASILFAILMTVSVIPARVSRSGFKLTDVLRVAAGLFFALLLAHIKLRNSLSAVGVVYIEYFIFIMYFMIVVTGTSTMLLVTSGKPSIFNYEDFLIPKLLYWPFLLGASAFVTLITFY